MENKKFLRARDVAHILDCCPDDLYPLIHTGELKASKVGRLWRFRLEDVKEYKNRVDGQPADTEEHGKVNSKRLNFASKQL